jgi:hypothetical protein
VSATPGDPPHQPVVVFNGVNRPRHLLADGDRVLPTDHDGVRVLTLALAP